MNAAQWMRNLRALTGMSQLALRKLAGKKDGWVEAIEIRGRRCYLSDLVDIWERVTDMGFVISKPTADLEGLKPERVIALYNHADPASFTLDRSEGGVMLATDASIIRGFGPVPRAAGARGVGA